MWTKENLMKPQTKAVKICGDEVVIRKLKAGEVFGKKESDEDKSLAMLAASLVEPALSVEEARQMPIEFVNNVMSEIMSFNGIGKAKEATQGN